MPSEGDDEKGGWNRVLLSTGERLSIKDCALTRAPIQRFCISSTLTAASGFASPFCRFGLVPPSGRALNSRGSVNLAAPLVHLIERQRVQGPIGPARNRGGHTMPA